MSIVVENLSFSYYKAEVLKELSFYAEAGKLLAVLGPNGVGKTTLFRCMLGISKKYEGKILIDDTEAKTLSARELAHKMAYIPQIHGVPFGYTALEIVLMGTSHNIKTMSVPKQREINIARDAMEMLGVFHLAEKKFNQISGGEQQLVLIARALAQQSKILLMDEPTSALDYGNQTHVLTAVQKLARQGYTVILSTHNPQHAIWYADNALALSDGRVAAFGAAKEILNENLIEKLYKIEVKLNQTESGPLISPSVCGNF